MRWWQELVPEETAERLHNPGRGWYQIYSFGAESPIDGEELKWSLGQEDSLALVLIDIGAYRDRPVDEEGLSHIRDILDFFTATGKDIILRPVYDRQGRGLEREPGSFSRVIEHIYQLGTVIREYKKSILVIQGLLVGSWGEMHTSRYLDDQKLNRLHRELDKALEGECYTAVRRPVQWRQLEAEVENYGGRESYKGRLSLFDDGIFGSETHLGTFAVQDKGQKWEEAWSISEELLFESWLGEYVPCGGEVVCPEEGPLMAKESFVPEHICKRLGQMRLTYLNRVYDRGLLDRWDKLPSPEAGIWKESSCLEYIGEHLGYRFVVRRARALWGKKGQLELSVENCGFGGLYQEAELWLVMEGIEPKGIGPEYQRMKLDWDPRQWHSGRVQRHSVRLPLEGKERGPVLLYLELIRKWDGRKICFANSGGSRGRVLLGICRPW